MLKLFLLMHGDRRCHDHQLANRQWW